jgi:hypothetical protein
MKVGHRVVPFSANRRMLAASVAVDKERHIIHSITEVDITEPPLQNRAPIPALEYRGIHLSQIPRSFLKIIRSHCPVLYQCGRSAVSSTRPGHD